MSRKLIYYVAASVDGYIERDDGTFDGMPKIYNTGVIFAHYAIR